MTHKREKDTGDVAVIPPPITVLVRIEDAGLGKTAWIRQQARAVSPEKPDVIKGIPIIIEGGAQV
ncbi:MAG: hypothetical protein P8123_09700 [bacterium]